MLFLGGFSPDDPAGYRIDASVKVVGGPSKWTPQVNSSKPMAHAVVRDAKTSMTQQKTLVSTKNSRSQQKTDGCYESVTLCLISMFHI